MVPSWHVERPDLSAEVQSLMNNGSLSVYENAPHGCFHIYRGYDEWISVRGPWGDAAREELRRYAYIAHNGLSEEQAKSAVDSLKKIESDGDREQQQVVADMVKNVMNYTDQKLYFYNK